ncbi:Protein N-acetyltransferase, RimJ/RimL family [Shouchella lonarensis]|uniref:Protein N-acetyltransferase, RimJ/RimL family n=1 Tax=Shouchella lonarensis TaxID=1464122 RepID=A0A1G6GZQ0_9BACI|nr:Protein N-acetyltransferase, RimJ/RimL family [Shouchella lonarensis]
MFVIVVDERLYLRKLMSDDLKRFWELGYKEEAPEWKQWDAPYFPHRTMSYEQLLEKKETYVDQDDFYGIFVDDVLIGIVSYYWEYEPSRWLETGILIYDPVNRGSGIGLRALRAWIDYVFKAVPVVERVGFTTWSGNKPMMRVGEKLGMTLEGRMRKCRFYNGVYYDSIRYGVLREEWL